MANDLNELNEILFDTLKGIRDGSVDVKKAQTIVNVGNSIVGNAKVQLAAFKLTGGKTGLSSLSQNKDAKLRIADSRENDRTKAAYDLAGELGYKSVAEAIAVLGKHEFNKKLDKYVEDHKVA